MHLVLIELAQKATFRMPTIWDYVENFEKRFGIEAMRLQSRALQIDCLSQLKAPLPEVAARGLDVAKRLHNGVASDEEREQARKDCWDFVITKYGWAVMEPEDCIVRAVIGTLSDIYHQGREPEAEHLEWFFTFVERFEGYKRKKFEVESPMERAFLRKYFPMTETPDNAPH